ncbi:MAG: hypothetical protein ACREEB_12495 [Caulobacteraceae bacterium]
MEIQLLRIETDYEAAMVEYEGYFDNEPGLGTHEADRFQLLGLFLAKYEEGTYRRRGQNTLMTDVKP